MFSESYILDKEVELTKAVHKACRSWGLPEELISKIGVTCDVKHKYHKCKLSGHEYPETILINKYRIFAPYYSNLLGVSISSVNGAIAEAKYHIKCRMCFYPEYKHLGVLMGWDKDEFEKLYNNFNSGLNHKQREKTK